MKGKRAGGKQEKGMEVKREWNSTTVSAVAYESLRKGIVVLSQAAIQIQRLPTLTHITKLLPLWVWVFVSGWVCVCVCAPIRLCHRHRFICFMSLCSEGGILRLHTDYSLDLLHPEGCSSVTVSYYGHCFAKRTFAEIWKMSGDRKSVV